MRTYALALCAPILLPAAYALAQEEKSTEVTTTETAAPPASIWEQDTLTGDWGGARSALADKGITFKLGLTQIVQGNAHGGAQTDHGLRYSGSGDLTLMFDTGKMGLWPGGTIVLNGEPKWGDGINGKVGSLIPVNMDAVKPGFGEGCMMTLSEYFLQQVLFDGKLVLLAGKLDGSRAFDANAFANDERTQFMNVALRNNVMIPSFLPYTVHGIGAVVNPLDWLSVLTAVTDSEGQAKTTGFETTFHGPTHTTVIHEWAFKIKPFDLPGTQRVGFAWSSREFRHHQPISPFRETGPMMMMLLGPTLMGRIGPLLPTKSSPDNIMVYYNFDQFLYTEAGDPKQGLGLFGRFGWARGDVNAAEYFYSIGMGAKGLIPERDRDTLGIGYFHVNLSNDLPAMFHSEQGVEAYYSFEITPWMHVSPDLQVIVNPGGTDAHDVSIVYGLRMQVSL